MAKFNVTCKSSNLIYCITCTKCKIQYVGQTKNRLMDRFQGHFYNIGHNRPMSEIGKHFNSAGHNGLDDVEIHIVDFIHAHPHGQKSKQLRDLIEFNWIQRMHCNAPTGLNLMDPYQSVIHTSWTRAKTIASSKKFGKLYHCMVHHNCMLRERCIIVWCTITVC